MIKKTDAILSLKPNAEWVLRGDKLEWLDKKQTKPTDSEIDAEVKKLQADYDAKAYQRSRKLEYPDIGDQLDDLYKAGAFSNDMTAKIKAVKDKFPK